MTMAEIKVKDVFPLTNGLFSHMPITSIDFGIKSADDMDLLLISKCGNRVITPIVELLIDGSGQLTEAALTRLGTLIVSEYGDSWERIRNALTLEYNPLQNSVYDEVETTDTEGETGDTSQQVNANDISSFNTNPSNYVSDGKTTSDVSSIGTQKQTVKRTLKRTANGTAYSSSDLVKSEVNMRMENRYTEQIITDVKNYIAMALY